MRLPLEPKAPEILIREQPESKTKLGKKSKCPIGNKCEVIDATRQTDQCGFVCSLAPPSSRLSVIRWRTYTVGLVAWPT